MSTAAHESPAAFSEPARPETWSIARRVFYIVLAFAIHVGLIFAFGNRKPIVARSVVNAPRIQLASGHSELQLLDDPTLFALPHPRGFAAATWLQLPRVEFAP